LLPKHRAPLLQHRSDRRLDCAAILILKIRLLVQGLKPLPDLRAARLALFHFGHQRIQRPTSRNCSA
jgi:hypothetical protein